MKRTEKIKRHLFGGNYSAIKHHYLRREFSYSNYEQNYTLPDDVDKTGIAAKVENGILTVTLPKVKKEERKLAKAIEIS